LAATHGPSSIIFQKQPHAQPWFDQAGAKVYPHYHVLAGHAASTGDALATASSDARSIQAFAVGSRGGITLWLSNLTARAEPVHVTGVTGNGSTLTLDEETFETACSDANWLRSAARTPLKSGSLMLKPYAIAEIRFD
jgi:hypothetical protein